MKLQLITLSETLPSSEAAGIIIDKSYKSDINGLPYIPGKTIKGLIHEAMDQLVVYAGNPKLIELKESLLGRIGKREGKLHFPNLELQIGGIKVKNSWDKIVDREKDLAKETSGQNLIDQDQKVKVDYQTRARRKVTSFVSVKRHQTAIGKDGMAKDGSLRTYLLLKPDLHFSADIDYQPSIHEKEFLFLSCLMVESMGVRRNRGWGQIRLGSPDFKQLEIRACLDHLQKYHLDPEENQPKISPSGDLLLSEKTVRKKIEIRLLAPVIIGDVLKSSFNVHTKKYIPGKTIRGLMANKYIERRGLQNAGNDASFQKLFLSEDAVIFKNAHLKLSEKTYKVAPNFLVKNKYNSKDEVHNLFEGPPGVKTKNFGALAKIEKDTLKLVNVTIENNFHHHRDLRREGRNKSGAIFYYDAISEGQVFDGHIVGNKNYMDAIIGSEKTAFKARIGRSRSAQYGLVEVHIGDEQNAEVNKESSDWIVYLTAPAIMYNSYGLPEVSKEVLDHYLPDGITVEKLISGSSYERIYHPQWGAYDDMVTVMTPGSSIRLKFDDSLTESELRSKIGLNIGEWSQLGYGSYEVISGSPKHYEYDSRQIRSDSEEIPPELKKYFEEIEKKTAERKEAFRIFKTREAGFKSLSNALLSRLIRLLDECETNDHKDWKEEIEKMIYSDRDKKDKPKKHAGQKLDKAGLIEPLVKLKREDYNIWKNTLRIAHKYNTYK